MSFVTHTIANLYNGVSQQPVTQRLPSQCQEQINKISRVSTGLSKRPRSSSGESLSGTLGTASQQKIFRSTNMLGEKITFVVYSDGSIQMKNLDTGVSSQILTANTYLENTDSKNLKVISKDNRYLFLNKTKTVTKNSGTATAGDGNSMIIINQGFYSTNYAVNVIIDGNAYGTVSYSTPAVTDTGAASQIIPAYIALQLKNNLISNHPNLNASNCVVNGNVVTILGSTSSSIYSSSVGVAGAMTTIDSINAGGSLQDFTKLPSEYSRTTKVKIQANPNDAESGYYVVYDRSSNAWIEVAGANAENSLMPQTMPIVIQETLIDVGGVDTPDFTQLVDPWAHREAGDDDSAPFPSIANNTIKDMFFWGDRLGFLSGGNLSLSSVNKISDETGDYEFFPSTTANLVESDRIDISASTSGQSINLLFALPQDRQLIIYAKDSQMILTSSDLSKARLVDISEYSIAETASPILVGYNAYIPLDRGNYAGIMNFTQLETTSFTAEEVTQHIPTYIKGSITELSYCANEDMVFVLTDDDPNTVYVNNRFIRNQELQQNAWHKWTFPYKIKTLDVEGSILNINAYREYNDGVDKVDYEFISMNLANVKETTDDATKINFIPLLDQHLFIDRTYLSDRSLTTGFTFADLEYDRDFVGGSLVGVDNTGIIYRTDSEILSVLETDDLHLGYIYNSKYTFSEQLPSFYTQEGKIVESFSKLIIRRLNVLFYDTGKFSMNNLLTERQKTYSKKYSSMVIGSLGSLLGKLNLQSGSFGFPINSKHDTYEASIVSESPYPCNFTAAEWSGTLTRVASRY